MLITANRFLAQLFGTPPGARGDYVFSNAELDRIVSELMEQHQGNAPPPAAYQTAVQGIYLL